MPELQVLVIDDDKFMLDMLPDHLETIFQEGELAGILTARTPEEGIAQARAAKGPLVVLCDYDLRASQNGVHVLEQIAAIRPDAIRILFSGHTPEEIGLAIRSPVIHAFLEKPLRLSEFTKPFRAILEREIGSR